MNFASVEALANAVLYEGLMLYPYRPSALKNQFRWLFGAVRPRVNAADDATGTPKLFSDCLIDGDGSSTIEARLRFLHPGASSENADGAFLQEVEAGPMPLGDLVLKPYRRTFTSEAEEAVLEGAIELTVSAVGERTWRLTVEVQNLTCLGSGTEPDAEELIAHSMVSTQAVLGLDGGSFVPLRDPPEDLREAVAECRSGGLWPVLVSEPHRQDMVLLSPIILDDYPQVAPESPGDFFDATEIDELLTLRILTLTPEEKLEMAKAGRSTADLLERTENLGLKPLGRLHGVFRSSPVPRAQLNPGDRVRLRPKGHSDILDLALSGRVATVHSLEKDFDGRHYVVVTVDDDPGKDLGAQGQPGHRFFFAPEEVELLPAGSAEPQA